MRIDGLSLIEGSKITNPVVNSGTSLPDLPSLGELYFLTSPVGNLSGFIVYDGSQWSNVKSDQIITSGATLPVNATAGQLFYLTQTQGAVAAGLVVYTNNTWRNVVTGDGSTGVTSITLDFGGTGTANYWSSTPQNPSSAVINVRLPTFTGLAGSGINFVTVSNTGLVTSTASKPYWAVDQNVTATGYLSVQTPTQESHVATKGYVDSLVTSSGVTGLYVAVNTVNGAITSGQTAINLSTSGDVTGSITASTPALYLKNSGVTAGNYTSVTVNAKGIITSGTNPTTLSGYSITDAVPIAGNVTMTGPLILSGAPTLDLQAATKKYVDDFVVSVAQQGVHNSLNGLQGGAATEYYHLTTSEHTTTQAMATTFANNGDAFLTTVQADKLALLADTGLPFLRSGTISTSMTQDITESTTLSLGFGTQIFYDNVGSQAPQKRVTTRLLLPGTSGGSLTINGLTQADPFGQIANVVTTPKLVFQQDGSTVATINGQSGGLNISGTTVLNNLTVSSSISSNSISTNSVNVSTSLAISSSATGTISRTPTSANDITNKSYVDTAITNAISGGLGHESLTGLQGGTTNQHYHLTASEYTSFTTTLTPIISVLARRDVNNNFTASQSFGNLRIQSVADPQVSSDAATKAYVDAREIAVRTSRIYTNTAASGAITINWANYDEARLTLVGDVVLTFTGALDGQRCMIKAKQDGIGSHAVTLPGTVRYSLDAPSYTATTTPSLFDRVGFIYDATDTRYDLIAVSRGYA